MRWTYENGTTALFGLCVGLWAASWLALISPAVPFFAAYPIGAWVLWRTGEMVRRHRAALKSTTAKEGGE